jgi:hypothetical protein
MKKMKNLFLIIAGLSLVLSCNKDEQANMPGNGIQSQNDSYACGKVFKVHATDGADITADLKQAFEDAKAAGPGSVVQLPRGNFELGFIEIDEFYGSFVGAGKGRTVLTAETGLDCSVITPEDPWAWLIIFVGGDVFMSDMTLKYPKGESVCNDGRGLDGLMLMDCNKAWVNNVEFIGEKLGDWWYHCWNALALGATSFDMKVTNCTFDAFGWGTQIIGVNGGKFTLGSKNNGNTFNDCAQASVFYDFINSSFQFVCNKVNTPLWGEALQLWNAPQGSSSTEGQTKTSSCIVEGNEFNLVGAIGVWLGDDRLYWHPEENLPVLFQVKNNKFNMNNDESAGAFSIGIDAPFVKGPLICNNQFTGTCDIGIRAATGIDKYVENGLVLWNDFSKTNSTTASIFLDEMTKNWKVIGNVNASVVNLGTGNVIQNSKIKSYDHKGQTGTSLQDHMKFYMGKFRIPGHE